MKLKDLRKLNKLSQSDVSKILHVSQRAYAGYELEQTEPTINTLIKLADYYNVSLDYLVGRDFAESRDSSDKELLEITKQLDHVEKGRVLGYARGRLEAQKEIKDIKIRTNYRA